MINVDIINKKNYFANGTRAAETDSSARMNDLKKWLPGLAPEDLAVSELNPIAYG